VDKEEIPSVWNMNLFLTQAVKRKKEEKRVKERKINQTQPRRNSKCPVEGDSMA
jgi:hypothetical protein